MTVDHYPLSQEKKCIRGCETLADIFTKRIGNKKNHNKKEPIKEKRPNKHNPFHCPWKLTHDIIYVTLSTSVQGRIRIQLQHRI